MGVRKTLENAWGYVKSATHEQRRGSNFVFHRGILLVFITSGIVVGTGLGCLLSVVHWKPTSRDLHYLGYPGKLFTGALKSMNVPIVLSSVISAAGSMDFKLCLKTVILGLCLFIGSTHLSSWIGVSSALLIKPVDPGPNSLRFLTLSNVPPPEIVLADVFLDLFRSFFPRNIVEATLKSYRTQLQKPKNDSVPVEDWKIVPTYADGTNFNGLLVYGIVMGLAAVKLGVYGKPLIAFTRCLSECVAFLSNHMMWAAPIGIASQLAVEIAAQPNIVESFLLFYKYVICVILSVTIWIFLVLVTLKVVTRRPIVKFLKDLAPGLLTAYGLASSLSAMPITLTCLDINGVNPRVSRFLAPVGYITSLAGSVLFTTISVVGILIIAEHPIQSDYLKLLELSLVAPTTVASVAGGSGSWLYPIIPLLVLTVTNTGYPGGIHEVFLPVYWLVDRIVTTLNTLTFASIIAIVCHIRRKDLDELPDYNDILKEGLVFKRLSLLKTSVTSRHSEPHTEDIETLKQKLKIDGPDPENITLEEKKQRKTLRRMTDLLAEPDLLQVNSTTSQSKTKKPKSSSGRKAKKPNKTPKFKLTNIKKVIIKRFTGKKKSNQVEPPSSTQDLNAKFKAAQPSTS